MHPADVANHGLANRTGTPVRTMMATRPPTRLADNSPAPRRTPFATAAQGDHCDDRHNELDVI